MRNKYLPKDLPYHLVVPSLPGYAFSSTPPLEKDLNTQDVARIMNQLMLSLGFEAGYIVQGGDIGSRLARILAVEHQSCKGWIAAWSLQLMLILVFQTSCTHQLLLYARA
jgi:microsomal epoxide hydrolase